MSDAFVQFGLLLASVWQSETGPDLVNRVATTDEAGEQLLYAADRAGGRHVLAPVADDYAFTTSRGSAVEVTEWRHPQNHQRYVDLVCKVDSLAPVFYRLADSIVERIQKRHEPCHAALFGAMDDWQRLLRPAATMSDEALRGLFGELSVLRLLAEYNPIFGVEAWGGPTGHVHDFATPHGDIEVKASKREGRTVEISSIAQLDEVAGVPLCLIRLRIDDSPNGKNISDLVSELVEIGCLRSLIVEKLDMAGFRLGETNDESRFVVSGPILAWRVTPSFPGLRTEDLPESRRAAVTRIKYTLDLLDAPGLMTEGELRAHLERMVAP